MTSAQVPKINACEEIEVGDIGGFGSTEELESHENRCVQQASRVCVACGKKLCVTHYELMHWDHDSAHQYTSKQSATSA